MSEEQLPGSFNDLITKTGKPVLVDFWAEWCTPCRIVSPLIEKIAREYKTKFSLSKSM